ncbi:MAG: hypothetical protein JO249_01160, partial [Acidobacteria bacterium]|nr:hypothetical protein [Acidobacteriota bacterium]
ENGVFRTLGEQPLLSRPTTGSPTPTSSSHFERADEYQPKKKKHGALIAN